RITLVVFTRDWRNHVHIIQSVGAGVSDVVMRSRGDIDQRSGGKHHPAVFDLGLPRPMQNHHSLLVILSRMLTYRLAGLEPHKAATHPAGLRSSGQQAAILPGTLQWSGEGWLRFLLREKRTCQNQTEQEMRFHHSSSDEG